MASTTVPYTVTYRQPGTEPPLFLAGTFTTVQWGLQEMGCSRDEGGEYVFESRVYVEPGREYQFKFKAGQDGPWVLDENKTIGELYFIKFPSALQPLSRYFSVGIVLLTDECFI